MAFFFFFHFNCFYAAFISAFLVVCFAPWSNFSRLWEFIFIFKLAYSNIAFLVARSMNFNTCRDLYNKPRHRTATTETKEQLSNPKHAPQVPL